MLIAITRSYKIYLAPQYHCIVNTVPAEAFQIDTHTVVFSVGVCRTHSRLLVLVAFSDPVGQGSHLLHGSQLRNLKEANNGIMVARIYSVQFIL